MKSYNVCLKDTAKTFTKRLFYSLFDCEQEEVHGDYLEKTFLKIVSKLEIDNVREFGQHLKQNFQGLEEN